MPNHNLGTIRGTIEIDYDGAGIVRATKDSKDAKREIITLGDASDKTLGAFKGMSRGALSLVGAVGAAYNAVTLLSSAVAVLAPVTAAALVAAPALILGYASAMVIAKVAVMGVGDAMSAAAKGGKEFDDAMKKLSPEAQQFVRQYRSVIPVLDRIKKSIQDSFFAQLTRGESVVAKLTRVLVAVTPQARGVASSIGAIARNIVWWISKTSTIKDFKIILAGVNAFLLRIRSSLGPVIAAFIHLAAQGAKLGGVVGGSLATALQSFAGWLRRIDVAKVFATAAPILQTLSQLFWDIVYIVGRVFSMFNVDGADAIGTLGALVATLAEFLSTAEGKAALEALGQALQAIAGAASQVFMAALQALMPVIIALTPAIVTLSQQISGVLVAALQKVGPLLTAVATYLSQNMDWIGPLALGVAALAAAYKVYQGIATAVATVQAILNASILKSTAAWIANTASVIANRIATAAMAVAQGVIRAATIAYTAVQWLLNVALTANPIGIVIVAVAALIAAIILLWKHSETFRNIVLAVWNAIKVAAQAVAEWFMTKIVPSLKRAWDLIVAGVKFAINIWKAQWNLAKSIVMTVINFVVGLVSRGIQNVKNTVATIKAVYNYFRDAFNRGVAVVRDKIGQIVSYAKSLPGKISSAIGNIGQLLYKKGVSLVQGFIDGMAKMIGRVKDQAKKIISAVTDFLPGSPAKKGPLSGRGYALLRARRMMEDFAQGLRDRQEAPLSIMYGAIRPVATTMSPTPSTTRTRPASALSTIGLDKAQRTYNIAIGNKPFTTLVVDALSGEPVTVSKIVNEGSRKSAWAGSAR